MRSLLKATDRRRLEIIEILLNSQSWLSMSELAKLANTTITILKND